jgi:hypothetical protein
VLFYMSPHCDHAFCKKSWSAVGDSPKVTRRRTIHRRWGQWAKCGVGLLGGGGESAGALSARLAASSRHRGGAAADSRLIIIPIHQHPPPALLDSCHMRHSTRCRCYDCTRLLWIWPDLFVRRIIATVERTKGLCSRLPLALQKQPPALVPPSLKTRILA